MDVDDSLLMIIKPARRSNAIRAISETCWSPGRWLGNSGQFKETFMKTHSGQK